MSLSLDPIATTKKRPAKPSKPAAEGDHRRKRRNRTTQSCLNCHTSKRMCDRQRPCGRCTQLGLTGLCVYEVDDPKRTPSDETARLQRRVAELEGVVRDVGVPKDRVRSQLLISTMQLKNKPHPRWASSSCDPNLNQDKWHSRAKGSSPLPDSEGDGFQDERLDGSQPTISATPTDAALMAENAYFSSASTPSPTSSSSMFPMDDVSTSSGPCHTPSSLDFDLSAFLSGPAESAMLNSMMGPFTPRDHCVHPSPMLSSGAHDHLHEPGHCGCLTNSPEYTAMLELSVRLRKVAETLRTRHRSNSGCQLLEKIASWDMQTSDTLCNVVTPPDSAPSSGLASPQEAPRFLFTASPPPPYPSDMRPRSATTGQVPWEVASVPVYPMFDPMMTLDPHAAATWAHPSATSVAVNHI